MPASVWQIGATLERGPSLADPPPFIKQRGTSP
jgi:hypothetical protein